MYRILVIGSETCFSCKALWKSLQSKKDDIKAELEYKNITECLEAANELVIRSLPGVVIYKGETVVKVFNGNVSVDTIKEVLK